LVTDSSGAAIELSPHAARIRERAKALGNAAHTFAGTLTLVQGGLDALKCVVPMG
jgi:hypothetical protein